MANKWIDTILEMIENIRPTKSWIKFKQYYKVWLGWLEQQFCKPTLEGKIDCICYKAKNLWHNIRDQSKEHCELKEPSCKQYCNKYCDHFAYSNPVVIDMKYHPMCGDSDGKINQTEQLLPSNAAIENYLDNFLKGKMCLA